MAESGDQWIASPALDDEGKPIMEIFGMNGKMYPKTVWYTREEVYRLNLPKHIWDECMRQGKRNGWNPQKMQPVVLDKDYPQPVSKMKLSKGTYVMTSPTGAFRIVPNKEMRNQYKSAEEAVSEAQKSGLIPLKLVMEQDLDEMMRQMGPQEQAQFITSSGADSWLPQLATAKWLSEEVKKVVRARAYRLMEEKGKRTGKVFTESADGLGEVVDEAAERASGGVQLAEAEGAQDVSPVEVAHV